MQRRHFIHALGMTPAAIALSQLGRLTDVLKLDERQPAIFLGHGSPMNAIQDNDFTRALGALGQKFGTDLPRPQAILMVSAHWETNGTYVCVAPKPPTIHDFGGYPQALFDIQYPAPGAPEAATWAQEAAKPYTQVGASHNRGLDHGAWSVLKFVFPKADIPVFQLSIDASKAEPWHAELGRYLRTLRDRGVLIMGSGNVVHNLMKADFANAAAKPVDWAAAFDKLVVGSLTKGDITALTNPNPGDPLYKLAVPTNEHYLPLLYVIGAAHNGEQPNMLYEGFQHGSISMRCIGYGI